MMWRMVFIIAVILVPFALSFSNYVQITWYYDESAWIFIDPYTYSSVNVNVGYIRISSPIKFSVYVSYTANSATGNESAPVRLTSVVIGNKTISMNPKNPTPVNNRFLNGTLQLRLMFTEPINTNDFKLTLTFNFFPL